jgi:hypothetical protein
MAVVSQRGLRGAWSLRLPIVVAVAGLVALIPSGASAAAGTRTVTYRDFRLRVPDGWPVFDLATDPRACVRFNRHAVYLGRPGSQERCPSHAAGRTEAILVEPLSEAGAIPVLPQAARIVNRAHRVLITATWNHEPATVARALGVRSLPRPTGSPSPNPVSALTAGAARSSSAGAVYTGQAFDACSTPNSSVMSAWSSAYHAIGVYIGGVNMACPQTNLTSGWVSRESAAGWHLLPIYVGLQAPSNHCGCAGISPSSAVAEGRAAAQDAVAQAQAVGLGPGNPVYYDMEGYSTGATNSAAVLSFLGAWTEQLHAAGYRSGVYSSDDSGISDLAARYGTGYPEPDDIWPANWNNQATSADPILTSGEWADHQRIHQYAGNLNQRHGGVTINIDSDYVDAATAAAGSATAPVGRPSSFWLFTGYGNIYTSAGAVWYGSPAAQGAGTYIAGMTRTPDGQGYWLTDSLGRVFHYGDAPSVSMSPPLSLAHPIIGIVASPAGGYWLYTAYGNVYTSSGTKWYGSPAAAQSGDSLITGMAATPDGKGYWLVDSAGRVFAYGDAVSRGNAPPVPSAHPITGITASPGGGFWLYTAYGSVYPSSNATWYGSPFAAGTGEEAIAGLASTGDGKGYWLVDSSGRVFAYGDAARLALAPALPPSHFPVTGIVG